MKLNKIIFSSIIMLSHQSSLLSSVLESETTMPTRRKSHDGTRDGMFGSAADTFEKYGQTYTGVHGLNNNEYRIGSDLGAPTRWLRFAQSITNLADAEKYLGIIQELSQRLPEIWTPQVVILHCNKSQTILNAEQERLKAIQEAELQDQIEKSKQKFRDLNQEAQNLMKHLMHTIHTHEKSQSEAHRKYTQSIADKNTRITMLNKEIKEITQEYQLTKKTIENYVEKAKEEILAALITISKKSIESKEKHNQLYCNELCCSKNMITKDPFTIDPQLTTSNIETKVKKYLEKRKKNEATDETSDSSRP